MVLQIALTMVSKKPDRKAAQKTATIGPGGRRLLRQHSAWGGDRTLITTCEICKSIGDDRIP